MFCLRFLGGLSGAFRDRKNTPRKHTPIYHCPSSVPNHDAFAKFCALTYGGAVVGPTHMGCAVVRLDACDVGQDLPSPKILTIPIFVWMWTTTCMIWDPKSILGLTNISLIRVLFSVPKKHPDQAHFGQKSSLAWCLCFRVYYALWPKPAWFWPNLVW